MILFQQTTEVIISLRFVLPLNRINELASLPFIDYVQAAPKEDEPINNKSRASTKANILNSSLPGGRNLRGEGVVIGVGDDSNPLRHVDFTGRLINRAAIPGRHSWSSCNGNHRWWRYQGGKIYRLCIQSNNYCPKYFQDTGICTGVCTGSWNGYYQ